jgi:hypothetical protein
VTGGPSTEKDAVFGYFYSLDPARPTHDAYQVCVNEIPFNGNDGMPLVSEVVAEVISEYYAYGYTVGIAPQVERLPPLVPIVHGGRRRRVIDRCVRGRPGGRQEHSHSVITTTTRPLTDHPTVEATALRGLWFGLLIALPFWLLMAAFAVRLL